MAVAQRAMTACEWGLLAVLSLLWGGSFFFIGVAVKELPPLTLAGLRVGLAALILWASASLTGARPPRSAKAFAALALLGLGNNALPFALIAWGKLIWRRASRRSSTRQLRSSPCLSRMSSRPKRS